MLLKHTHFMAINCGIFNKMHSVADVFVEFCFNLRTCFLFDVN